MSFLFGTLADISIDIILFLEFVLIAVLFFGYRRTIKGYYSAHGRIMLGAAIIQLILIAIVMIPSLIRNVALLFAFNIGLLIILTHVGIGLITILLAGLLIYAWQSPPKNESRPRVKLPCRRRARLMLPAMIAWMASFILGTIFYIVHYMI